jgi:hypothetical protein
MVRAILHDGAIRPVSPLPESWPEGQELLIEAANAASTKDWAAWSQEIEDLASQIPPEDFERVEAALAEADRGAKEMVRRGMGFPG